MYLTAILDLPFWILKFWLQIFNQRLQKPPSKSFQTDLSTFKDEELKNYYMIFLFFPKFSIQFFVIICRKFNTATRFILKC